MSRAPTQSWIHERNQREMMFKRIKLLVYSSATVTTVKLTNVRGLPNICSWTCLKTCLVCFVCLSLYAGISPEHWSKIRRMLEPKIFMNDFVTNVKFVLKKWSCIKIWQSALMCSVNPEQSWTKQRLWKSGEKMYNYFWWKKCFN